MERQEGSVREWKRGGNTGIKGARRGTKAQTKRGIEKNALWVARAEKETRNGRMASESGRQGMDKHGKAEAKKISKRSERKRKRREE